MRPRLTILARRVGRVLRSLVRFGGLATRYELSLCDQRLGHSYRLIDGHGYRVFRETTRRLDREPRCAIEVGFRLRLIGSATLPHWLFQRACILTTPFWSGFEGFGTKLWMVDPETRSYAGIYAWASAPTARGYLDVLLPVLRAVSVSGSVFSQVHEDRAFEDFLQERSADALQVAGA